MTYLKKIEILSQKKWPCFLCDSPTSEKKLKMVPFDKNESYNICSECFKDFKDSGHPNLKSYTNPKHKEGVEIRKGDKFNIKNIYNKDGKHIFTYKKCPQKLTFKNPMINDYNQHLCEGWTYEPYSKKDVVNRVIKGLKPMAHLSFTDEKSTEAKELYEKYKNTFDCIINSRKKEQWDLDTKAPKMVEHVDFIIAKKGSLQELFNLKALISDYANAGIDISEEVNAVQNKHLKDFFDNWDNRGWLTGLILGYPIENTISLYLE